MNSFNSKRLEKIKLLKKLRLQEEQISEMKIYIETLKQIVKEKFPADSLNVNYNG